MAGSGRSPSGSGCQPSASAVPASQSGIPNAVLPGDIVQITNPDHQWFPCLIVISEPKSFGAQGFAFMPANDGSGTGEAYIRLRFEDFEPLGANAIILSESTARDRASAMSASGQDRETGLEAKPASAVGEAETPDLGDGQ
jgi:hypothetical protein